MTTENDALDRARRIALTLLADRRFPTPEDLEQAVDAAIAASGAYGPPVDRDALHRALAADVNVYVGDPTVLIDPDADHRPWLDARRAEIPWRFWDAYEAHLRRRLAPDVVRSIDDVTDQILEKLEDPSREGPWDTRGMVVGSVQSGKTANYTGLISKAADAGYNFIVVLAGLHNGLRSQTQARIDEGFIGLDSRMSVTGGKQPLGVGAGRTHPAVTTLTSSDELGDFSIDVASRLASRLDGGSQPHVLVIKKNRHILDNLISWITKSNGVPDPTTGQLKVTRFPLLLIDDEADNASVNTNDPGDPDLDPTAINARIRTLLASFERSTLVSYTATPFANIFIDGDSEDPSYGEDLFPRSFIVQIQPPSNYIGPARVFGIPAADDPDGVGTAGLPVCRLLADNQAWLTTPHNKTAIPGPPPASLIEAMRAFVLACAARSARGQSDQHNSMLVHVTRFVDVQNRVAEQIRDELERLTNRISGADTATLDILQRLWEDDFQANAAAFEGELAGKPVTWPQVRAQLTAAATRIRVLEINGSARDALTYADHPDGVSVIAVGGDKLSRGLTLEGLSVSYYLRASRMYDTLMQMGRWFGYRPGYSDLIRLYTTKDIVDDYSAITVAAEELNAKFREMARVGSRPTQFAFYVRHSPAGLLITAPVKMRSARPMRLTFSGDVVETIGFLGDATSQQGNRAILEGLLTAQTAAGRLSAEPVRGNQIWRGVPGDEVASTLAAWKTTPEAKKANGVLLAHFIRDRIPHGQLTEWTIALVDNSAAAHTAAFAGAPRGLSVRSHWAGRGIPKSHTPPPAGEPYTIQRLGDQTSELFDLSSDELRRAEDRREEALQTRRTLARQAGEDPAKVTRPAIGPFTREIRPESRGLLVIYLLDPHATSLQDAVELVPSWLVSFPEIENVPTIEYRIPARYMDRAA